MLRPGENQRRRFFSFLIDIFLLKKLRRKQSIQRRKTVPVSQALLNTSSLIFEFNMVGKVKVGAYATPARGCGAHLRSVGPLSLWWVTTNHPGRGQCEIRVSQDC